MPLFWLSTAFLLGLLLGAAVPLRGSLWLLLAGEAFVLGWLEVRWQMLAAWRARRQKFAPLPAGVILGFLLLGAARFQVGQPAPTPADLAWYNGRGELRVQGWVCGDPDTGDLAVQLRVCAEQLPDAQMEVDGVLLARLPAGFDYQYGDVLILTGKPFTPPQTEDFSYRQYLAGRGIHSMLMKPQVQLLGSGAGNPLMAALYHLRRLAYARILQYLPQPEASLLGGILLGIESDIPQAVEDAFRDTGTAHIIAISGFNMAVLAALFAAFANRVLPRRWAFPVALLGITLYTLLVGAEPPVVRAAVMGGMGLLGAQLGRRQVGVNSLTFTAAAMCLFNPLLPWDAGFQLSFCATLGLVLFADPLLQSFTTLLEKRFSPTTARSIAAPVGEYFLFTLAAQAAVLPVTVMHFRQLSWTALLANPLVLPPQPLVMILGGIAVLVGLIFPPLGRLLAMLTYPLLAYTIRVVEGLAQLPGGVVNLGQVHPAAGLVYALLLMLLALAWHKREQIRGWVRPAALLVGGGLLAAVIWQHVLTLPDGRLHLTWLAVDGGPALFIQSPAGRTLLIDGGARSSQVENALGRRLPLTARRLDAVLVSGAADSLDGLAATLERYPSGLALIHPAALQKKGGSRLLEVWRQQDVQAQPLIAGQTLDLNGVRVEALQMNAKSMAVWIEWKHLRALLPNGQPPAALRADPQISQLSLLLLSPQDLQLAPLEEWLTLQPQTTVMVNELGGQDVPGVMYLRPGEWLRLSSDGEQMWAARSR